MRKYSRVLVLVLGLVLMLGVAAPAFAEDCGDPCTPPPCVEARSPGYWTTHPEAWPVESVNVGGVDYSKAQAIALMTRTGEDKSITLFRALVSVKLDLLIGCEFDNAAMWVGWADGWFQWTAKPGSGVTGKSQAWKQGEGLYTALSAYYTPVVLIVEPVVVY